MPASPKAIGRITQRGIPAPKRGDAVLPPPKAKRKASLVLGTSRYFVTDVKEETIKVR